MTVLEFLDKHFVGIAALVVILACCLADAFGRRRK